MDQLSSAEQLEQKGSYWRQHIDSWQETGLTQTEYCRQHKSIRCQSLNSELRIFI
jgi:hypothetical protein